MAATVGLPVGVSAGGQICKMPVLALKVCVCCPVTEHVWVRFKGGVPVKFTVKSKQLPRQTSLIPEKVTDGVRRKSRRLGPAGMLPQRCN